MKNTENTVMHYVDILGDSESLEDAFNCLHFRLVTRHPHLETVSLVENQQKQPLEKYLQPRSGIALLALHVALGIMQRINAEKVKPRDWIAWEEPFKTLHVRKLPIFWLVPALECGFYISAPTSLWDQQATAPFQIERGIWDEAFQKGQVFLAR